MDMGEARGLIYTTLDTALRGIQPRIAKEIPNFKLEEAIETTLLLLVHMTLNAEVHDAHPNLKGTMELSVDEREKLALTAVEYFYTMVNYITDSVLEDVLDGEDTVPTGATIQ